MTGFKTGQVAKEWSCPARKPVSGRVFRLKPVLLPWLRSVSQETLSSSLSRFWAENLFRSLFFCRRDFFHLHPVSAENRQSVQIAAFDLVKINFDYERSNKCQNKSKKFRRASCREKITHERVKCQLNIAHSENYSVIFSLVKKGDSATAPIIEN